MAFQVWSLDVVKVILLRPSVVVVSTIFLIAWFGVLASQISHVLTLNSSSSFISRMTFSSHGKARIHCLIPSPASHLPLSEDQFGLGCSTIQVFYNFDSHLDALPDSRSRIKYVPLQNIPVDECGALLDAFSSTDSPCGQWAKTRAMLLSLPPPESQLDFYVKVDDDTLLFSENLLNHLEHLPSKPDYFGHVLDHGGTSNSTGFYGAHMIDTKVVSGAMVAFSARALHLFQSHSGIPECADDFENTDEDVHTAMCFNALAIQPIPLLDEHGKPTVGIFPANFHLSLTLGNWWYFKSPDAAWGAECCSELPVAFHGYKGREGQIKMTEISAYVRSLTKLPPLGLPMERAYWRKVRDAMETKK